MKFRIEMIELIDGKEQSYSFVANGYSIDEAKDEALEMKKSWEGAGKEVVRVEVKEIQGGDSLRW
ncbi:hypothetical protein IEN91_04965 [Bacillus velezensis]|uniref:hypothetical protein n=1 Tax=Bacillus velezensis TaxID=492670 RepID=UPI0018C63396|nr:hypothetical protein [Bacillus velezensis]QPK89794.1 hypothetical protein IEN91_04965 [Bacillus velezensis]